MLFKNNGNPFFLDDMINFQPEQQFTQVEIYIYIVVGNTTLMKKDGSFEFKAAPGMIWLEWTEVTWASIY